MKEILSVMALVVAVLFVSVQYAEAETLAIEGENENTGIFLVIEDDENLLILDNKDGYAEFEDSKIKTFKNGGFSLKNPSEHIAVWGAPFGENQYKLVILTSEGIQRITAEILVQED